VILISTAKSEHQHMWLTDLGMWHYFKQLIKPFKPVQLKLHCLLLQSALIVWFTLFFLVKQMSLDELLLVSRPNHWIEIKEHWSIFLTKLRESCFRKELGSISWNSSLNWTVYNILKKIIRKRKNSAFNTPPPFKKILLLKVKFILFIY